VLIAVLGILVGVLLSGSEGASPRRRPGALVALTVAAAIAAAGIGGGYAALSHDRVGVAVREATLPAAQAFRAEPLPGLTDVRGPVKALQLLARADAPSSARERDRARRVLDQTASAARLDEAVEADRVRVLARLGDGPEALRRARALAVQSRERAPFLLLPLAELLADGGSRDLAADLVAYEAWRGLPANAGQYLRLVVAGLGWARPGDVGPSCASARLPGDWRDRLPDDAAAKVLPVPADECETWAAGAARTFGEATDEAAR